MADKITSLTYGPVIPPAGGKVRGQMGQTSFDQILKKAINDVDEAQKQANKAIEEVHRGKGGLAEAMIAMEKASITLQAMLTVRNKVIEAYQEVMRMQV
ncbi:MAG: flagellar hook-basal body complex protein FliE [Syntrophales bacterium]|nr:flagellar hook-basal body complex protein FliE [Syntrophales bacterium]